MNRFLRYAVLPGVLAYGLWAGAGCDSVAPEEPPPEPDVPIRLTWTPLNGPRAGGSFAGVLVTDQGALVAGLYDGIHWTDDEGRSWQRGEGFPMNEVQSLVQDNAGRLFASFDEHVYVSEDGGKSWRETSLRTPIVKLAAGPDGSVYALTFHDGLQRTEDGGVTWQASSARLDDQRELPDLLVQDLIVDAQGNLFAATLEGGVVRRPAGATTWQQAGLDGVRVYVLAADPDGVLYAGGRLAPGFYRSRDAGTTWELIDDRPPQLAFIYALETDDSGTVYAATLGNRLYRSQDGGNSWQRLPWVPPPLALSLTARSDGRLLVSTYEGLWQLRPDDPVAEQIGVVPAGISVMMAHQGRILAGLSTGAAGGLYRMEVDEDKWTRLPFGGILVTFTAWTQAPGGRLFIGTTTGQEASDGNVYVSSDGGISWTSTDLPLAAVKALVHLETGDLLAGVIGSIFSHTPEGGVYRSEGNGQPWRFERLDTDIHALAAFPDGTLLAGGRNAEGKGRLFRSTDRGRNWDRRTLDEDDPFVEALAVDGRGYAYAGTAAHGIYRSTDKGRSWRLVASNLSGIAVHSLLAGPGDALYAGTEQGLYASSNGTDWRPTGDNLGAVSISSLVFDEAGDLYAGTVTQGVLRGKPAFTSSSLRTR